MSTEICFLSALELARRIRAGEFSPSEAVGAFLDRIGQRNREVNAFITLLGQRATEGARATEAAITEGRDLGPLHGVPLAIKDLTDFLSGVPNTWGCRAMAGFVPDTTSVYVQRLIDAGAIILGKTNTPEFGHKGVTDNLLIGPTSTPYRIGSNAGGSSGGSAAAVADGMAAAALGSDAGGSIRIPAAFCGVFGLKPSFGRVPSVSRPNAFLAHTPFLHVGPLTRTVADAALILDVIAGPDPADPLCLPETGSSFLEAVAKPLPRLKIAYSPCLEVFPVEPSVVEVVGEAVLAFEQAGATIDEVTLRLNVGQQAYSDLWLDEMAVLYAGIVENLAEQGIDLIGNHREDLPEEFTTLIERGRRMSALDARRGDRLRTEVFDAFQAVFAEYDLLVSPTLAVEPFENDGNGRTLGPASVLGQAVDPTIGWCLTYLVNFTGHPAASIPAGLGPGGLPVGMQLIGRRFDDATLLAASSVFEQIRPWQHTYPGLATN